MTKPTPTVTYARGRLTGAEAMAFEAALADAVDTGYAAGLAVLPEIPPVLLDIAPTTDAQVLDSMRRNLMAVQLDAYRAGVADRGKGTPR